jgi:predicted anti-sigma-YlaC factor YlaD
MSDPTPRDFTDLLGGVLGPAEPELTCEECFEHLDRYVELELACQAADMAIPGMHAHLEGCPACREDHDSLHALARSDTQAQGA